MDAVAILGAIRGVIRGELGSVRVVPADAFGEGLPASYQGDSPIDPGDGARWLRANAKKSFDVELDPPGRSPALGPSTASKALLVVGVRVTLVYAITIIGDVASADYRFAARALAAEDTYTITAALEWPGNLRVDTEDAETALVSQRLSAVGRPRVVREDWRAGLYEVELRFQGHVLEDQPYGSPIVTHDGDDIVTHTGDRLIVPWTAAA